ncbi:hypothetical protein BT69DRAFT_1294310 [Atractiella rhizophila]|nr:hypothetical protein BT69DRAFT_1294310 [Atractiella rhizophila]
MDPQLGNSGNLRAEQGNASSVSPDIPDQAVLRFISERRMEEEAPRIKIVDWAVGLVIGVIVKLVMSSDKGDRLYLGAFICLLLLLAGIAVLDIISRVHARTSGMRLYHQKLQVLYELCCWALFWAFCLFVTYYFVAECLDDTHKGGQIADGDQMVVEMI